MTVTPELEAMAQAAYAERAKGGAPKLSRWATWDELDQASRERECAAVRAALVAMREPDVDVLAFATDDWLRRQTMEDAALDLWKRVVDHILGEPARP